MGRYLLNCSVIYCSIDGLETDLYASDKDSNNIEELDAEGNDTEERFNLTRSFLEYLGHSQDIVGNEAYYIDEYDVQTCRETLKIIFDAMNQSQHYEMMTKKTKKIGFYKIF